MKKLLSILALMLLCLSMTGCQSEEMKAAIAGFEAVTEIVEQKNSELDSAIQTAETLLAEESPALDELLVPALETAVSECKAAKYAVSEIPQKLEEIIAATEEMRTVDYTSAMEKLSENQETLEESIRRYSLVNAPSEAYVIECLKKVPNIIDIAAVTEDNDPNGQLNKQGGYTAHVYFSSDLVDQSIFDETSVIENGTDCGGSVEVYSCVEDATRRNEYLSTFDGGILASGSHTIVGTVLVRTSDKLTATKQKTLEASIIAVLTYLEGDTLDLPKQESAASLSDNSEPETDISEPAEKPETTEPKPIVVASPARKELAVNRANEIGQQELGAERQWLKDWLIQVEGFSEDEAQYALDNCQVNWNTEALEFANLMGHVNYTNSESWTTPNDVIRELKHRGFTSDEISYVMDNCRNFDWVSEATTVAGYAGNKQQVDSYRTYTYDEVVTYLQALGFSRNVALAGVELCGIDWSTRE